MTRYTPAPTEFKMNSVDAVCVNDHKVLAASFERTAGLAWPMTKLHAEP